MEFNVNNLSKLPNEVKQIIHAEDTNNSDYVMKCINTMYSAPNTFKKLWLQSSLHSEYIKTGVNEKEEIINTIFSSYVEPLLKYINHPALIQEWKLNLDAEAYEKN